jgi:hypothetical protein
VSGTLETKEVESTLETFFAGLDTRDAGTIQEIWHPDAKLFLHNAILNARPLSFLLGLPDLMDFQVREIRWVDIQGAIATARVDYSMSVGVHSGYFHLAKADGRWRIANWVDHGLASRN